MASSPNSQTGTTVQLLLLNPADPQAWKGFVQHYAPKIYGWCRKWRLQEADAENVTQDVLALLARKMTTFTYDPTKGSFRGWLKTLTQHAWSDYLGDQRRAGVGAGGSEVLAQLQTVEARDDLARELEQAWERELLDQAEAQVQLQVSRRDWKIFTDLALDGRSGAEVAAEFQMKVTAVLMVRSRVQRKLRQAVRRLEGLPPED
jgi:RNA polymerase sigma-70 factor (ECF subfamily)